LRYDVVYMHADGNEKFDATPVRCLKN
jgi:hypothetical protein